MPTRQHTRNRTDDHNNMRNTAQRNTNTDGLEATEPGISDPAAEDGERVGKELEGVRHGGGDDTTFAERTGRVLGSSSGGAGAVAACGELAADEVFEDLLWRRSVAENSTPPWLAFTHVTPIVRSALCELDATEQIRRRRHTPRDSAQSREFLLCRFHVAVGVGAGGFHLVGFGMRGTFCVYHGAFSVGADGRVLARCCKAIVYYIEGSCQEMSVSEG